jgi:hypothetical protein
MFNESSGFGSAKRRYNLEPYPRATIMTGSPKHYWRFTYKVTVGADAAVWRGERLQDVGEGETMELAMQQFAAAKQLEAETELSIPAVTVFARVESVTEEDYQAELEIDQEARRAATPVSNLQFDHYESKRQQLRALRLTKQIDKQREEFQRIRATWPLPMTPSPLRRFLYAWLAIISMMLVCLAIAWVGVQIASVIADYTNRWVALVTMLALYGALAAWSMTSTPEWFKRIAVKAFGVTDNATTRRQKIS